MTRTPAVALARAEWTKWSSTRVPSVYGSTAVGLSVLITCLLALAMNQANDFCGRPGASCRTPTITAPDTVVTAGLLGDGSPGAGLIILMLLGASSILVEHRYGTIASTFLVAPRRGVVIAVKAAVAAGLAFVLGVAAALGSGLAFVLLGGSAAAAVTPWSAGSIDISIRSALVVGCAAVGGVAVAAVVRNAVVVVTLVVIWPLVVEPLLPALVPGQAERVAAVLPFTNARHFVGLDGGESVVLWSPNVAGVCFVGWMLMLLAAAVLVTERSGPGSRV
ncbi:MAG: hypothetical protein ACRCSN_08150 [Dermatophilaceae bacterium]